MNFDIKVTNLVTKETTISNKDKLLEEKRLSEYDAKLIEKNDKLYKGIRKFEKTS